MSTSSAELDTIFFALSNAKRREIIRSLAIQASTVGKLANELHISLPSIHRHIRDLEAAGLLHRKKVGRTNFLAIRRAGLSQAKAWMQEFQLEWGNDQESLDNYK